jgi:hypothetical protein
MRGKIYSKKAPGWAMKSDPKIIEESIKQLLKLAEVKKYKYIALLMSSMVQEQENCLLTKMSYHCLNNMN